MADTAHSVAATGTRGRLVEIATGLVEEGGAAAVTFREVGRRAGLSHNAAHKLFGSKQELLAAVAAAGLIELREELDRHDDPAAPLEAARRMIHAYVDQATTRPRRFELTYGTWPDTLPELTAAAGAARGRLVETVARAQQLGQLPPGDPDRLTALMQSLAHGAAQLTLVGHLAGDGKGGATPDDLVDDLFAALRAAA